MPKCYNTTIGGVLGLLALFLILLCCVSVVVIRKRVKFKGDLCFMNSHVGVFDNLLKILIEA